MAANGRPRDFESKRRQREMLRLLAAGVGWREAAKQAGVKPDTVLGLLDRQDFACVAKAILEERITVAVIVEQEAKRLAA